MSEQTGSTQSEWNDLYELVDAAIADLPQRLREPVVSNFLEGRSHADIAKELGVSRQTVTVRVRKGIEAIRITITHKGVQVSIAALTAMLTQQSAAAVVPVTVTAKLGKLALAAKSTVVSGTNSVSVLGRFFSMNIAGFSVVTLLTLGIIGVIFLNGGPTALSETQIAAAANEGDFAVTESEEDQEPTVEQADVEDVIEASNDPLAHEQAVGLLQGELLRFQGRPDMSYSFETSYELVGGKEGPNASQRETKRGLIRWGGDRVEIECLDDKWYAEIHDFRQVRHEHRVWKKGRALGLRTFTQSPAHNAAFTHKTKTHDGVRPDMTGWFLDGVLIDSDHFSEMLLKARDLSAGRDSSDPDLVRIEGTTGQGRMVVWLDAEEPHVFHRAHFEAGSRLLAQISDIDAFTLDVTVEKYEDIDGVLIPSIGVGTYTYDMPDEEKPIAKQFTARRSDIVVNPDFDAIEAFRIDFPEGTVISDYDKSNTQYRWVNGKRLPFARPEFNPSQVKPTGSGLLEFAELQKNMTSPYVSIESNTPTKLTLTLQGKPLHSAPHAISLRGLESDFVDPLYATVQETGYLDVVFAFKNEKDSSRRIKLIVTLIDADDNTLKSFTRECKDQRIDYEEAIARGTVRMGIGGIIPILKENHEEFWTLHKAKRSILLSAEEIHITFEEIDR